eukprot:c11550_g1_i1.p1 GENE.c11550_g1_i1~~c11550_g1_i1.p1  ORF type:complete len:733 (+),score=132.38 c11550_g1_i1:61-2199(+)
MIASIRAFTPLLLFTITFVSGTVLLVHILNLAPTNCALARNVTLPATPCERESGFVFSERIVEDIPNHSFVQHWLPIMFSSGIVAFSSLYAGLFIRAARLHKHKQNKQRMQKGNFRMHFVFDPSTAPPETKFTFHDFLTKSRRVLLINTCLTTVSAAVWLGLVFGSPHDLKTFLRLLDPYISAAEYVDVLTFYLCHNHAHATLLFALESFLAGCGFVSIAILLLPTKTSRKDIKLGMLDVTNCLFAVWTIPFAYYVPTTRCYSLYLLSGFVRTIRAFYGVPEIAREYKLLAASTTDKRRANKSLSLGLKNMLRLLFGELALLFKVGTFVFSSTLMMNAVEGWACTYRVPEGISPCSCAPELAELISGFYFIVTVCATVGFGDFAPITAAGRFVIIFVMLSGAYQLPDWLDHLKGQRANRVLASKLTQIQHNASRSDGSLLRVKRSGSSRDRIMRILKRGGSGETKRDGSSSSITTFNPYPNIPGERNSLRNLSETTMIRAGLKAGIPNAAGRLGMGAVVVGNLADVSGLVRRDEPALPSVPPTEQEGEQQTTQPPLEERDVQDVPDSGMVQQVNIVSASPIQESHLGNFAPSAVGWFGGKGPSMYDDDDDDDDDNNLHQLSARMAETGRGERVDGLMPMLKNRPITRADSLCDPLTKEEYKSYCDAFRLIQSNGQRLRNTSLALQAVMYGLCATVDPNAAARVMERQQARFE